MSSRFLLTCVLVTCTTPLFASPILEPEIGEGLHKFSSNRATIRQEAARLPADGLVLAGTLSNARETKDGEGRTDFTVTAVLRQGKIKAPAKLVLGRSLPIEDAKKPPLYLVFCDRPEGKFDPFRGFELKGGAKSIEYVKRAIALDAKKPADQVAFFFGHLEDDDPAVANDAFLEIALASDRTLFAASHAFSAQKLRGWLTDPRTTTSTRLSLYAMLLGACGKDEDAKFLRDLLDRKEERFENANDGLLLGYVWLKPDDGWRQLEATLADEKAALLLRNHARRVARFLFQTQRTESRAKYLKVLRAGLRPPDLADVAIDDLRREKLWDLTADVLKLHGNKRYDSPVMRRALIQYALAAPHTDAVNAFLAARRRDAKELVEEIEGRTEP